MSMPTGRGLIPWETQELEERLSVLSCELSTALDSILAAIQRAPHDQQAIALARELLSAQYAVTRQLITLAGPSAQTRQIPALQTPPVQIPAFAAPEAPPQNFSPLFQAQAGRPGPDLGAAFASGQPPARGLGDVAPAPAATLAAPQHDPLVALLRQHLPSDPAHLLTAGPPQAARRPTPWPAAPAPVDLVPAHVSPAATEHARHPEIAYYAVAPEPAASAYFPGTTPAVPHPAYVEAEAATAAAMQAGIEPAPPARAARHPTLPHWITTASPMGGRHTGFIAGGALVALVAGIGLLLNAGHHGTAPPDEPVETAAAPAPALHPTERPVSARDARLERPVSAEPAYVTEPAAERQVAALTHAEATALETGSFTRPSTAAPGMARLGGPLPDAADRTFAPQSSTTPAPTHDVANAPPVMDDVAAPSAEPPRSKALLPAQRPAPSPTAVKANVAAVERTKPPKADDAARMNAAKTVPPTPKPREANPAAEATTAARKPTAKEAAPQEVKTANVAAPPAETYAPVLVELKNAQSLNLIFRDLKGRYPGLLGNKSAELRPVAGPDNVMWMALLAVPAGSKDQAQAVCDGMGAEGRALRCRVTRY